MQWFNGEPFFSGKREKWWREKLVNNKSNNFINELCVKTFFAVDEELEWKVGKNSPFKINFEGKWRKKWEIVVFLIIYDFFKISIVSFLNYKLRSLHVFFLVFCAKYEIKKSESNTTSWSSSRYSCKWEIEFASCGEFCVVKIFVSQTSHLFLRFLRWLDTILTLNHC